MGFNLGFKGLNISGIVYSTKVRNNYIHSNHVQYIYFIIPTEECEICKEDGVGETNSIFCIVIFYFCTVYFNRLSALRQQMVSEHRSIKEVDGNNSRLFRCIIQAYAWRN